MDVITPEDPSWSKIMDCSNCGANLKIYSNDLDAKGRIICPVCGKSISVVPKARRSGGSGSYSRDKLTAHQVEAIIRACEEAEPYSLHDHLFLRLLAATGRRLGEILAIKPNDIDFQQKCAWVHVEKRGDMDYKNLVFLDDKTLRILSIYLSTEWEPTTKAIFPMSRRTYQYMPDKYVKLAGLNIHISVHSFRHYVITRLREQGWSGEDIQKITGHKSVSSIATYDHTTARIVEDKFRRTKLI